MQGSLRQPRGVALYFNLADEAAFVRDMLAHHAEILLDPLQPVMVVRHNKAIV